MKLKMICLLCSLGISFSVQAKEAYTNLPFFVTEAIEQDVWSSNPKMFVDLIVDSSEARILEVSLLKEKYSYSINNKGLVKSFRIAYPREGNDFLKMISLYKVNRDLNAFVSKCPYTKAISAGVANSSLMSTLDERYLTKQYDRITLYCNKKETFLSWFVPAGTQIHYKLLANNPSPINIPSYDSFRQVVKDLLGEAYKSVVSN